MCTGGRTSVVSSEQCFPALDRHCVEGREVSQGLMTDKSGV